jgi:DNA recombination protein RmuC
MGTIAMIVLVTILLIIVLILIISMRKEINTLKNSSNEELLMGLKEIHNQGILLAGSLEKDIKETKQELTNEIKSSRQETLQFVQGSFRALGEMLVSNQKESAEAQDKRLAELNRQFTDMSMQNEQKLEHIRKTMETRITALQEDNSKQLDQMRQTVDEKLQKTLEDRISQSFKLVSERLEQVYRGLGEMQTLASGVGDLKKVLSNVKTRGILGEIQLGAILEQILSPEQYVENMKTKPHGTERVEFAIKLPGDDNGVVYLPIDAKFPGDSYSKLVDAYDTGNTVEIDEAIKNLEKAIKKAAKDIHDKYVEPPATTDFAIMFLPFEGLYAEVVRRGLVETLQREYKINIAGPTTMAALLNSLQMGFKTLAIQKHSSEVWDVLGAVKTEFDKFGDVLAATQQRINQANTELDKLIGTRTRSIQKKLRGVSSLTEIESKEILEIEAIEVAGFDVNDEE